MCAPVVPPTVASGHFEIVTLELGKLADLAVLSDDPLAVPEDQIPELHSVLTMVGGSIVHRTGDL